MRYAVPLLLCFASYASAQTPEQAVTLKFLGSLYDAESGGYCAQPKGKPSLRATNAVVKATKYLGGKLEDKEKTAKFVLGCYDDKTGAFAEPGGKPDVTTSCIGVMAAMELGIAKEKIAKAQDYITVYAKEFEEVRMACAAVEAWGGPKDWKQEAIVEWFKTLFGVVVAESLIKDPQESVRVGASGAVALIRLGIHDDAGDKATISVCQEGQRDDGGWGKAGEKGSDMESVYRVMRAFFMLKEKPKDPAKLRSFIAKHRNHDGGYAAKPGEKSSAAVTYYAVIVTKWLDELEKK